MSVYVPNRKAVEILGLSAYTLREWADNGKIDFIRTPGNVRLYNVSKYVNKTEITKNKIYYCHVTSVRKKEELEQKIITAKKTYPNHIVLSDTGSPMKFKRKNLLEILEMALQGTIDEIIIESKESLCGDPLTFDLMSWMFMKNGVNLVIETKS